MGCVFFFINANDLEAGCDPHKEILEDISVADHEYAMHARFVENLNNRLRQHADVNGVTIACFNRHLMPDYNIPLNTPKYIEVWSSAAMSDGTTKSVSDTYFITKKPTI